MTFFNRSFGKLRMTKKIAELICVGVLFAPVEYDFAGIAGAHGLEGLLRFRIMKVVCNNRPDIKAALNHNYHFLPRLIPAFSR